MEYQRSNVRAYFAGLTPDSKPMGPYKCPIQQAVGCEFLADATRLDPALARRVDGYVKSAYGRYLDWSCLTAGEVVTLIDGLDRAEAA